MAVEWPVGKLELINSALAVTGDNLVNVADDGSDEWNVCSPAYERGLAFMLEDHGWVHATKVNANLTPSATAPKDDQFDTAYGLPSDLLHLIWVRLDDVPVGYDILAGQLVLNAQGGPPPPSPPVAPGTVSIKYVSTDNSDPTAATPTFVLALQTFVMSGISRGLHGDAADGDRLFAAAMGILQRAKTRSDQQKPKRALWNSRITASRRVRRPWPPMPPGWGNTGTPG